MSEFQLLVDSHYEALYRFAMSLSKSADTASDLVQQTFCIWAQKGHQLKDRDKAKTWLFTTLHREFLAHARKEARHVDKGDDRDLERVAEAHEPRALLR